MAYEAIKLSQKRVDELNRKYNLWPELTIDQAKRESRWLEDKKRGLLFGQLETKYDHIERTEEGTRSKFVLIREDKVTYIDIAYDLIWQDENNEAFVAITVKRISSEENKPKGHPRVDPIKFLVQRSFWTYFTSGSNEGRKYGIFYAQLPDPVYVADEDAAQLTARQKQKTSTTTVLAGIVLIAILLFGLSLLLFM